MFTRKHAALAMRLLDHLEGGSGGKVERLIAEIHEAAAHNIRALDENPELKMGVVFMLQGTAKALAAKRAVRTCIDRKLSEDEEQLLETSALAISRAALTVAKM